MLARLRDKRGQAIVETAIVVPLLVTLLLGAFVGGSFLTARVSAVNAARQGARMAALLGGATINPARTASENQALVDERIISTVLAAAKLPNATITEIDIYCHLGSACVHTSTTEGNVEGTFDPSDEYDKFTGPTGVPDAGQQTFTLDLRTQVPPDEASIGIRIVYDFTSPINGPFAEFTQTLTDYAVMKAGSVLV